MQCSNSLAVLVILWAGAAAAAAANVDALIQQLDSEKFSERKSATGQLTDLGAAAIPAVKEAATSDSPEVAMRALSILQAHLQDGDAETKELAKAALEELAAGEGQAARRAQLALDPDPAPDLRTQVFAPGRIVIRPPVARIQVQQVQGNGRRVRVRIVNGVRDITVEANGQKIQIRDDPNNGIQVEITEKKDGKETTKKYEAKDAAELKQKHPEGYKIYEEHGKQNGIQIQAARRIAPAPAAPQRIEQGRQDHFDQLKKNLDDQIQKFEQQAQQAEGIRKDHYERMADSLKRHRGVIEEMEKRHLPAQAPGP